MSPAPRLLALVALGGALGAVVRWALLEVSPDPAGTFPWTTLAVNVVGSALLAAVGLLAVVRRSRGLAAFLGPGVMGGFTTLSAASEQTRALLDAGRPGQAAAYVVGSLAAALLAVTAVHARAAQREDDRTARGEGP